MIRRLLRWQTRASFDYQWRELPTGAALLSDSAFLADVDRVIAHELLCLRPEWFAGRRVLDAGSGNGRWTVGLLRLGASVTATDVSPSALEQLEANVLMVCTPEERARLSVLPADLLDPPGALLAQRFDLVFSFGVLHHTGDTRRALANIARLTAPAGVLFLYLYGSASVTRRQRLLLGAERLALAALPFAVKRGAIARLHRWGDPHQLFDLFSPTINDRHSHEEVENWLRQLGFEDVVWTQPHTELFVRAAHRAAALSGMTLASPAEPSRWFSA